MGTELNQAFFSILFMLINVEGRQDSTPEGVAHWLHLSLTVATGIAAVGLLLYVWNRQIEKRGDSFRSLVEYGTDLILAFGADGPVVYHRRNTLNLPVKSPPTCPPDSQATNLAYVRSSPIWPAT